MTLCNCYWEWVLVQYEDQREREGEGEGEAGRDAKVLAGLPWCSPVNPSLSVALRGHLYSSRSLIMGALPTAAARCNGVCCIRLSLTLEVAPLWKSSLAMSMLDLDAQKCRAVWPASSYTKQSPGKKKKEKKKETSARRAIWYLAWRRGLEGSYLLFALTSAPLLSNFSTSNSPSFTLTAHISGVQPMPSRTSGSKEGCWMKRSTIAVWLKEIAQWIG